MNLFKRGLIFIKAHRKNSLIIFIIVFTISNIVAGSIAVYQSAQNAENSIKSQLNPVVSIEAKPTDNLPKHSDTINASDYYLSAELLDKMVNLPEVKVFDYTERFTFFSDYLKRVGGWATNEDGLYDLELTGVQYHKILQIEIDAAKLIAGRTFTQNEIFDASNLIVITESFANEYDLNIGSKITLQNNVKDYTYYYDNYGSEVVRETIPLLFSKSIELEVIGIYAPELMEETTGLGNENEIKAINVNEVRNNTLYVPLPLITNEMNVYYDEIEKSRNDGNNDEHRLYITPYFVLNSYADISNFVDKINKLLPQKMQSVSVEESYTTVSKTVENYEKISLIFLIFSIIIGIFVLSLLIKVNINVRETELAVLLSLGEKKIRIASQIVFEIMLISLIAISIALFSGQVLAKSLTSNTFSINTIERDNHSSIEYYGVDGDLTSQDVADSYKIALSLEYIMTFFLVIFVVIIIATGISIRKIASSTPRYLLTK